MNIEKKIKIVLTAEEAVQIINDHLKEVMAKEGYIITGVVNEDGPWPDTEWHGVPAE